MDGVCHDDHVGAFFHGHVLVVTADVARGLRKMRTEIVHTVVVGIKVVLLVDVQRGQNGAEEVWVDPEEEWHSWEHDVDGVGVAVGRDLFLERERLRAIRVAGGGRFCQDVSPKHLTSCHRDDRIVRVLFARVWNGHTVRDMAVGCGQIAISCIRIEGEVFITLINSCDVCFVTWIRQVTALHVSTSIL